MSCKDSHNNISSSEKRYARKVEKCSSSELFKNNVKTWKSRKMFWYNLKDIYQGYRFSLILFFQNLSRISFKE